MRFFDRLALLIRADAHGVMDQLEERQLLLKQHLRDAEIELARKRGELAATLEEHADTVSQAERCESEVARLDEDVELALAGDNEELARFALRRLLPRRDRARELRERAAGLEERHMRLAETVSDQAAEFESLRQRVAAALAAAPKAEDVGAAAEPPIAEEQIDLELLRRRAESAAERTA